MLLFASAARALGQGCAMCGSSYGEADPTGRAISWSVLFLMTMPYVLAGSVASVFFFAHRRSRGRRGGVVFEHPRMRMHKGGSA
jgi:hypothetical protein